MTSVPQWERIPGEMRNLNQWLLAAPDENGDLKVPTSCNLQTGAIVPGKSTGPETWLPFDFAVAAAKHYGLGIGFVISANDPFVCIDLDVKNEHNEPDPSKWTGPDVLQRHQFIVNTFDSYTEISQSGQGLHIWVYGAIGRGVRRDHVEVYSQERFIVCTGRVLNDKPIQERNQLVNLLASEMRQGRDQEIELVELPEEHSDEEIVSWLSNAVNGAKFNALCACTSDSRPRAGDGSYREMGYPTQSEADLALMSMFCFHSKSNIQCMRLFRMSGLAKRDKAMKDDVYLKRTLRIIRGRQSRETEAEEHGEQVAMTLLARMMADPEPAQAPQAQPAEVMPQPAAQTATPVPVVQAQALPAPTLTTFSAPVASSDSVPWPPGFVGAVARFIFESSYRPVREVAIVSALGLIAGICGKAWNIPQSGLNLYIILIARSAVGKEAMHSGISNIMHQCMNFNPNAFKIAQYVDFNEYASGPALVKAVAAAPSMLNVSGEWGKRLKMLAQEEGREGPMSSLRRVMLNLYQKSAHSSIVGGIGYSDKEKNVTAVNGVAYSMIGETTPGTFFESLTEHMMEDGFLSRFTIMEYDGARPSKNTAPRKSLSTTELEHLTHLLMTATITAGNAQVNMVQFDAESKAMLDEFDLECDREINKTHEESWRQMWNRAHLKVCRVAALLGAADCPTAAQVYRHHVEWALDIVRRDIAIMSRKLTSGDVGVSDISRERKLLSMIAQYFRDGNIASYNVPESLRKNSIVPRKYLQIRVGRVLSFAQHRFGATKALDDTLRSLVDSGYIMEMDKSKLVQDHGFHGKAFRVLDVPMDILNQSSKH